MPIHKTRAVASAQGFGFGANTGVKPAFLENTTDQSGTGITYINIFGNIAQDSSGNIYVGMSPNGGGGYPVAFASSFTSAGASRWDLGINISTYSTPGNYPYIVYAPNGYIYLAGSYFTGSSTYPYISQISSSGSIVNTVYYTGLSGCYVNSLSVDSSSNLIITVNTFSSTTYLWKLNSSLSSVYFKQFPTKSQCPFLATVDSSNNVWFFSSAYVSSPYTSYYGSINSSGSVGTVYNLNNAFSSGTYLTNIKYNSNSYIYASTSNGFFYFSTISPTLLSFFSGFTCYATAVDSTNAVYCSNGGNAIYKLDSTGSHNFVWGMTINPQSGGTISVNDIAISTDGNYLLICGYCYPNSSNVGGAMLLKIPVSGVFSGSYTINGTTLTFGTTTISVTSSSYSISTTSQSITSSSASQTSTTSTSGTLNHYLVTP